MKGAYPRLGTGACTHKPEPERDNWIVTTGQRALRRPFEEGGRAGEYPSRTGEPLLPRRSISSRGSPWERGRGWADEARAVAAAVTMIVIRVSFFSVKRDYGISGSFGGNLLWEDNTSLRRSETLD
jgi:hypothetical protein